MQTIKEIEAEITANMKVMSYKSLYSLLGCSRGILKSQELKEGGNSNADRSGNQG